MSKCAPKPSRNVRWPMRMSASKFPSGWVADSVSDQFYSHVLLGASAEDEGGAASPKVRDAVQWHHYLHPAVQNDLRGWAHASAGEGLWKWCGGKVLHLWSARPECGESVSYVYCLTVLKRWFCDWERIHSRLKMCQPECIVLWGNWKCSSSWFLRLLEVCCLSTHFVPYWSAVQLTN